MEPITTFMLMSGAGFLGYLVGSDGTCSENGISHEPKTDEEKIERAIRDFEPWAEKQISKASAPESMHGLYEDYLEFSHKLAGTAIAASGGFGLWPGVIDLFACWYMLKDPETPMTAKAIVAAGLLYIISPADIIPDEIPLIGIVDDIAILKAVLLACASSLRPRHYEAAKDWFEWHGFDLPFYEPMVPRIAEQAQAYGP